MIENLLKNAVSPVKIDWPGFKLEGPACMAIPALVAILFVFLGLFVWLYQDARKRNKNEIVTILFIVLAGWPLSLVWWFWLRPPLKNTSNPG